MAAPQRSDATEPEQPKAKHGGRPPQAYVRFQQRKDSRSRAVIEMILGRAVWYEVGMPERVALEWVGDEMRIVPDAEEGWTLHIRRHSPPRCRLPADIRIEMGRYSATVQDGKIVVGAKEQD